MASRVQRPLWSAATYNSMTESPSCLSLSQGARADSARSPGAIPRDAYSAAVHRQRAHAARRGALRRRRLGSRTGSMSTLLVARPSSRRAAATGGTLMRTLLTVRGTSILLNSSVCSLTPSTATLTSVPYMGGQTRRHQIEGEGMNASTPSLRRTASRSSP
jgi:hypothetical protein